MFYYTFNKYHHSSFDFYNKYSIKENLTCFSTELNFHEIFNSIHNIVRIKYPLFIKPLEDLNFDKNFNPQEHTEKWFNTLSENQKKKLKNLKYN